MSAKSIVFIDSGVSNYQSILDSFLETTAVFVLDSQSDGLTQMVSALYGLADIDAIHIISHGSQGALYLGSTVLDSHNLAAYGSQLASIGSSLTQTGDILLYGCDVAQGDVGFKFIGALAQMAKADVAASDDATGAAALGGDWVLEQVIGSMQATSMRVERISWLLASNTAPTFFVGDGKVTTDIRSGNDQDYRVTLQTDGKILMAGSTGDHPISDFALARYNSNGSLDTSFDTDGKVTTDFGSFDEGYSVTLQTDGKILVAGYSGSNFALARYNSNGSLDTSFDIDGKVTTDFDANDISRSVTLQADGKILVAGYSGSNFALARYNSNGSLDTSFDIDGKLTPGFSINSDQGYSVALQTDGKILVVASSEGNFALARYNSNGSLDTSFDIDGKVTTDFGSYGDYGSSVTLQADGKIIVTGSYYNGHSFDFALARYNTNGNLDTSFDTDGKVTTDFGALDISRSVTLQADGKILVAGYSGSYGNRDFALARYNSNGSLDTSFDTDGKVTTNLGKIDSDPSDSASDLTVQADGKILVVGSSNGGFALARYNTDGSLDASFSPPENTLDYLPFFTEPQYYYSSSNATILDPDVQIFDTELAATGNYNGATLTLQRHAAVNPQDVFSAASSALTTLATGSYFAIDSITIGRVTNNSAGTLMLTFNANATQSLVSKAMQQIAYVNTSDAPPATVQIDWTFNDGNSGAQGTGGALSVTGSTTVQITATNDAPVLNYSLVDQNPLVNTPFSYTVPADAFIDPDLEPLSYSIRMNDGTGVPPWLSFNAATRTFSGTPGVADAGDLGIVVTAKDISNATASYTVRLSVSTTPVADTTAPTAITFAPADESTGVAIASNIVVTFNEPIAEGTGNIVLKTSDGLTVATYDAATSPDLSISGSTLTINPSSDLGIYTGYKLEMDAGVVKDLAGNNSAGVSDYNFSTQTLDGMYHFFVVAFAAAPGVEYMNQLATAYNAGMSLKDVVNVFTTKHQFTDVYPTSLSHNELAIALVNNIVENSATAQAKSAAAVDITNALDAGWTVGDMIYQVFGNLATKPLNDADWGQTAQQFQNQTAVAKYFTEVMGNNTVDLPTLRTVVGSVDNHTDVSTPVIIATLIGVELAAAI